MAGQTPPGGRQPVRALAAWMDQDARARLDRGGLAGPVPDATALVARAAVDQSGLLGPVPEALADHVAALRASDGAQRMFEQGWELAMVGDLRRVIAAQPTVATEPAAADAVGQAAGADAVDALAVAALTLPLAAPAPELSYTLDEPTQTWEISSPNPNLRISGTFGAPLAPGVHGFGFMFSVMTSYLSIADCGGRLVLRDGYHRTFALLAAGVTRSPAFVRRYARDEPLFVRGMLSPEVYLGAMPPTLADYHDDAVATDAWLTERATWARVQATPASLAIGTIGTIE